MLTKKDKAAIEELFRGFFETPMTIHYGPKKQGDPEEGVTKEEMVFILPFLAQYLPKIEGGLRGFQETLDHVKNINAETRDRLEKLEKQVGTMADIIFQHQEEVTLLTKFVGKLGDMGFLEDIKDKLKPEVIEMQPEGQKRIGS